MSPLLLLSFALQIACCVHVVRTGRPLYWVFILLLFSFLAVIIYFIAEILPELRHHPSARRTVRSMRDRIDPDRDRRDAAKLLKATDTPANRRRLAEESLRSGDYAHASELYGQALKGLYATDPDLMLGLAKAQFGLGESAKARATLDALIAKTDAVQQPKKNKKEKKKRADGDHPARARPGDETPAHAAPAKKDKAGKKATKMKEAAVMQEANAALAAAPTEVDHA